MIVYIIFSDLNHEISYQLKMMTDWLWTLIPWDVNDMKIQIYSHPFIICINIYNFIYTFILNPDYVRILDIYLPSEDLEKI